MVWLIQDSINRANNADLGTTWTPVNNTLQIISAAARAGGASIDCCERWNTLEFPADQWAQCRITGLHSNISGNGIGPAIRCSATAFTNFNVICNSGVTELWSVSAGTFALIQSVAAVSVGDLVRLEGRGSTIIVRRNFSDSPLITATSTVAVSGYPGLEAFEVAGQTASATEFEAGDFNFQLGGLAVATPPNPAAIGTPVAGT